MSDNIVIPISDKPDGRKNNGGHKTAGRKEKAFEDKKQQIEVFLSPNEFKKKTWKSNVCDQVENKMNNKLKNT